MFSSFHDNHFFSLNPDTEVQAAQLEPPCKCEDDVRVRSHGQLSCATLLSIVITGQLAVVQFEAVEGAGAKQKHVLL